MNYDKFEVIWIGSRRNSTVSVRFLDNLNLKWNPRSFKVLGNDSSTDLSKMKLSKL